MSETPTAVRIVSYSGTTKTEAMDGYPVFVTDYAGEEHLVAICPNASGVRQIALALGAWHNVSVVGSVASDK